MEAMGQEYSEIIFKTVHKAQRTQNALGKMVAGIPDSSKMERLC
jgi:hypothetical protein